MDSMKRIRKLYRNHEPQPIGRHRFFSVLVPFVVRDDGEICLMYEVRAKDLESDPGEICFPGGHVEPNETLLEAALRETEEETGIPRNRIRVLGQGDVLQGYANYSLYTFIGEIQYEDYCKANIQKDEVDELFLLPLSDLDFDKAQIFRGRVSAEIADDFPYDTVGIDEDYRWRSGEWVIPVLRVDDRPLWGLTARITHALKDLLDGEGHPSILMSENPLKETIPAKLRRKVPACPNAEDGLEEENQGVQIEFDFSKL